MTATERYSSLDSLAKRLDEFLTRRRVLYLFVACVLSVITFSGYSHAKLPWEDEVLQMTIARQPTGAAVWKVLRNGYIQVDPPMLHETQHYLFQAFGEHAYVARVPAILGFTLMCLCAALLVWRHAPAVYAAAAFFVPWATVMRSRAMDARPYGVLFGFTALSVLCWDGIQTGRNKTRWRIAFTLSFAVMLCSHFYSVLIFLPLALAELAKWYFEKRPDWKTWLCAGVAMIPYLVFTPTLISAAHGYLRGYYYKAAFSNLYDFYGTTVASFALAGLFLFLMTALVGSGGLRGRDLDWSSLSERYRLLLIWSAGFLLIPVGGYAAGVLVTKLFVPYYHFVAMFCLILGIPLVLAAISGRSRLVGLCLFLAIGLHGLFVATRGISGYRREEAPYPAVADLRKLTGEPRPDIVVASPQNFLPYYEAFRSDPVNSLLYLYDPEKALAAVGSDTADKVHLNIRTITTARIEPFDEYIAGHKRFYIAVMGDIKGIQEWQFKYFLRNSPQSLTWLGKAGDFELYRVQF